MNQDGCSTPVREWKGGFAHSDPDFAYPNPNLSSLPMPGNMENICKLDRQQRVDWPEFSWETQPGKPASRCFQMFAPDISRIGYTDTGRVYSIICPQQGIYIDGIGYMNVEVTVTGQRGWVDENTKELAADMTVQPKVWFSKSAHYSSVGAGILKWFDDLGYPFPGDKDHAILINTYTPGNSSQPILRVSKGESPSFKSPDFTKHKEKAWTVGNVEVEIGDIQSTGNQKVDEFNNLVMNLFNAISGNLLLKGNVLSWNVWFYAPEPVDREEWRAHAERWRKSINEDHGSPDGPGTVAKYANGSDFSPGSGVIKQALEEVRNFLSSLFADRS